MRCVMIILMVFTLFLVTMIALAASLPSAFPSDKGINNQQTESGNFYQQISDMTYRISKSIEFSDKKLIRYNGSLSKVINKNGYGHCGYFSYLLYDQIVSSGGNARIYYLETYEPYRTVHAVVAILDPLTKKWLIADPTTGIFYNATLQELQNTDYWATHTFQIDPRFDGNAGNGLYGSKFYNANQSILHIFYLRADIENALWSSMLPSNQSQSIRIFNKTYYSKGSLINCEI